MKSIFDQFNFQSQEGLFQINEGIRSVRIQKSMQVIRRVIGLNCLFVGRKDIVKYWDFPHKISKNCQKSSIVKIVRQDQRSLFAEMYLLDRLACLVDFVGMKNFRLQPQSSCFFKVCLPISLRQF